MKVYVDKMPKNCGECKFHADYKYEIFTKNPHTCCELWWLLKKEDFKVDKKNRNRNCPLHTLEEVQNEKAIECLERIKILCKSNFDFWENSEYEGNIYDKHDVSNAYLNMEVIIDQPITEFKGEKK